MLLDSKYFSPERYAYYFRKRAQAWEARPRRYSAKENARLRGAGGHHRYTVIAACYNVEAYVAAFIDSLLNQRLDFARHLHLIFVDDGSTDGTADAIKRYAAQHPGNITYLYKENGGPASARNAGLDLAQTEWVAFMDPDDTVDFDAFYRADKALATHPEAAMVLLREVQYHEETGAYKLLPGDWELLRRPCTCCRVAELGKKGFLPMHTAPALLRRSVIKAHGLRMAETCRPVFEDTHFLARYVAHVQEKEALFLRFARYYHRRRAGESATMHPKWTDKRTFGEVVRCGPLDMLRRYADMGLSSDFAARAFIADLLPTLRRMVNHPHPWAFLSPEERAHYLSLLRQCLELISAEQVESIRTGANNWYWRMGMLFCLKQLEPAYHVAIVERFSQQEQSITLRLFAAPGAAIRITAEGQPVEPVSRKSVRYDFGDELFVHETLLQLPEIGDGKRLSMSCDKRPVCFAYRKGAKGDAQLHTLQLWLPIKEQETLCGWNSRRELRLAAASPDAADTSLTPESVRRAFPCPPPCADAAYNHAWVFMDRLHLADDNAEHLYRYTAAQHPEFPIYYVLHRDSADWARLEAEGFRLLPFGSKQHKAALRGCDVIISSHVNEEQLDPFRDDCLVTKKYVFLQHGVTHDSCYNWLNGPKIDLFVATTPPEWKDVQNAFYKYTDREVKFVGFPRYDALLKRNNNRKKSILIMPTWRSYLMWTAMTAEEFSHTTYFRRWNDFFNSDILRRAHEEFGYEVSFFAHPGLRERTPWMGAFRLPSYVTLPPAGTSYGQLFSESTICITDYSSAIFDAALLQRAIVYYQFDRTEFWSNHLRDPGYFSFEQDGFGPIAQTPEAMEEALGRILENDGEPLELYRERMARTFPLRDGRNCERCYRAIREMLHLPPCQD